MLFYEAAVRGCGLKKSSELVVAQAGIVQGEGDQIRIGELVDQS